MAYRGFDLFAGNGRRGFQPDFLPWVAHEWDAPCGVGTDVGVRDLHCLLWPSIDNDTSGDLDEASPIRGALSHKNPYL
jgi:hypothetical protein